LRCAHCPDTACNGGDGGHLDTVGKLIARITRYADYMRVSGGGVTVAGAEPLEQAEFVRELFRRCHDMGIPRASSDHHLERMIVTREDGEAVWAERRLDQAAWAFVRPVRSAFQFHGSRQSS